MRASDGSAVMRQRWSSLLFLHWELPAEEIQRTLPDGLEVDTFEGRAYLGVVPFFMSGVRPRFLPPVPGLSDFLELNLRTYVRHKGSGRAGVWFYSLDAGCRVAVWVARRLFHLPYFYARMDASREASGAVRFQSRRLDGGDPGCHFEYSPEGAAFRAGAGTLEHFLVERYVLFSAGPRGLMRGTVAHEPYTLFRGSASARCGAIFQLNGFDPPGQPADHVLLSPGVDVSVRMIRPA